MPEINKNAWYQNDLAERKTHEKCGGYAAIMNHSMQWLIIEVAYVFAQILLEHSPKHCIRNFSNHDRNLK